MNLSHADSEAPEFVEAIASNDFEGDDEQIIHARDGDGQGGRRRSRKRRNRRNNNHASGNNSYRDPEQQHIPQRNGSSRYGWTRNFAVLSDEPPAPPPLPRRGLGRACSYD
ncbi:MAG: hypothetical protein Kow0010_00020 [Dehalococcoidia bacterium]